MQVDTRVLLESMQYTYQRAVLDKSYSYARIDAVSQYRIAIPYRDNASGSSLVVLAVQVLVVIITFRIIN